MIKILLFLISITDNARLCIEWFSFNSFVNITFYQVIVATHAILQKRIHFYDLGLIVIDEEQRLGVSQKEYLLMHAPRADVLTMSATPIPRTLQLSMMGFKDLITLSSPPPSRKSVNIMIDVFNWDSVRAALQVELERKGQVLVVIPHIKASPQILQHFKCFNKEMPSAIIEFAHGQMHNCSEIIKRFRDKKVILNAIHLYFQC